MSLVPEIFAKSKRVEIQEAKMYSEISEEIANSCHGSRTT